MFFNQKPDDLKPIGKEKLDSLLAEWENEIFKENFKRVLELPFQTNNESREALQ